MLRVFDDTEALVDAAADLIVQVGLRDVAEHGEFHLVLSGGSTPRPIYELLASRAEIDRAVWHRAHVWWGDERCVPPDDPRSNFRMAHETLLGAVGLPEGRVHRICAESNDLAAVCAAYGNAFPKRPDLLMLGMGADGHTASLFPGAEALEETVRRFVPTTAPAEPPCRVTATPTVLASARNALVVVVGAEKAEALGRVFAAEGDVNETPARLLRNASWFADAAAAEYALAHLEDADLGEGCDGS